MIANPFLSDPGVFVNFFPILLCTKSGIQTSYMITMYSHCICTCMSCLWIVCTCAYIYLCFYVHIRICVLLPLCISCPCYSCKVYTCVCWPVPICSNWCVHMCIVYACWMFYHVFVIAACSVMSLLVLQLVNFEYAIL